MARYKQHHPFAFEHHRLRLTVDVRRGGPILFCGDV